MSDPAVIQRFLEHLATHEPSASPGALSYASQVVDIDFAGAAVALPPKSRQALSAVVVRPHSHSAPTLLSSSCMPSPGQR